MPLNRLAILHVRIMVRDQVGKSDDGRSLSFSAIASDARVVRFVEEVISIFLKKLSLIFVLTLLSSICIFALESNPVSLIKSKHSCVVV